MPSDVISEEELATEALAADPNAAVASDAVSLWDVLGTDEPALLPGWYQPAPMRRSRMLRGWRRRIVVLLIVSFFLIDAAGLCVTYGHITLA